MEQTGLDLLESLNTKFPYDCGRRETIRLDQQSRLIAESAKPQTGIYWWVPNKNGYRLVSFFDEEYGAAYHKEIWEKYVATILGIDDIDVPLEVRDAYHGLPRGRVSREKSKSGFGRWIILHGKDSPVSNSSGVIASRFRLPVSNTAFSYDSHEIMIKSESLVVKNFLAKT